MKGFVTQASAQSKKTQREGETRMFPGFKSRCPSVSGTCRSLWMAKAFSRRSPIKSSSRIVRGSGDRVSCDAMNSAMRARKGATRLASLGTLRSLHWPSRSALLFPIEAISSSASSIAALSQMRISGNFSSVLSETSSDNQAFQD